MNATELFHQDGKTANVFYCGKCRIVKRSKEEAETCWCDSLTNPQPDQAKATPENWQFIESKLRNALSASRSETAKLREEVERLTGVEDAWKERGNKVAVLVNQLSTLTQERDSANATILLLRSQASSDALAINSLREQLETALSKL